MILIADSGSTKTEWQLVNGKQADALIKTKGINPYYQEPAEIASEIADALIPALKNVTISRIFFYGAGCSTLKQQKLVYNVLSSFFKRADIFIDSDLLGSARALCGYKPGIICILGTGSGSCRYDGEKITEQIPSLGFILGDEGSGAWIGKRMITDFLRGDMPEDCIDIIKSSFKIDKETILENVNHKPMPGSYLAKYARFISNHTDQTYFYQLIFDSFAIFAENYILRYKQQNKIKCHFVGSVAYHNIKILEEVAGHYGFKTGNILKSPIEGLIKYHTEKTK